MIGMILFLIPRLAAIILAAVSVYLFVKAKRRGRLEPLHYWLIGMAVYDAITGWVSGILYWGAEILFILCMLGYTVSVLLYAHKEYRQSKARTAEIAAQIAVLEADIARQTQERDEIQASMHSLGAEMAQLDQERGEIVRALDLVESWQAVPGEELAVRQGEINASWQTMEARYFDEE